MTEGQEDWATTTGCFIGDLIHAVFVPLGVVALVFAVMYGF